jgi:mono/diheme cytochrome c family protein
MQSLRALAAVLSLLAFSVALRAGPAAPAAGIELHRVRSQASDLEIGGVVRGETRFVAYDDLLKLPQVTFTVSDDSNFTGPVRIGGVPLEKLQALLGAPRNAQMAIAICDDNYQAHYTAEYLRTHHPVLVLRVNGHEPAHWPLGSDHVPMGPYMITHAGFKPAFKVLAHADEPQVPWGVVRLDLRNEAEVYAPILPRGPHRQDALVQQGYTIARQNCFRCHALNGEGGTKSSRGWEVVARRSVADPQYFDQYVRAPKKLNPASQMAASPAYDAATLAALRAYFQPFAEVRP